ncbi:MAG: hypothetical protein ACM3SU_17425 [Acidobacteriota bacterium]
MRLTSSAGLLLAFLSIACGPPTLKPTAAPDPQMACPGRWTSWSLEVLDRRAEREASEKVIALLADSIQKSFPGCSWKAAGSAALPAVSIEIYRFAAPFEDGTWNGVADWSVRAMDPEGRTLVSFEAQSDVERPNYQGSNNEKEALQQVFAEALKQTLAVLRSVSNAG